MLKIKNTEVLGWGHAIRDMRNPMNSWGKSGSEWVFYDTNPHSLDISTLVSRYQVGPDDLDLMTRLRNTGIDHRKFMRMIAVYADLIGPLYWWKEFDTYKVGAVANSCFTMYKTAAKEFTLEDFLCEHLFDSANGEDADCWTYSTEGTCEIEPIDILNLTIATLNKDRELYLDYQQKAPTGDQFAKNHAKEYRWQMIQLFPSSYNQQRTVMLNYEVLASIYKSRRNHRLDEWYTFCDWIKGLSYNELITGPSLKDILIDDEIMEEAKRRVHEELNAQLSHFCKIHEGFSIKIPREKVVPEVLNLIDRVEQEEQQRVEFGNHISLAYYCQRCDAKKNGEATDAYYQKCPYKVQNDRVKIVEISVMSNGSPESRFVMETEDDRNEQQ